jgi:dTDP-4-dehydrorhamnose 3,5-epimerase
VQFEPTAVDGAWLVRSEPSVDHRGSFVRFACERTLKDRGLVGHFMQTSVSVSHRRGTLRGMHYQAEPHGEVKLVRCIRGSIQDVVVDLRPQSPTYLRSASCELSAGNQLALYIPEGCAHGLLTLEDDCHVLYQISVEYVPGAARGVRWNDPAFAIDWPFAPVEISPRDAAYPDYVR